MILIPSNGDRHKSRSSCLADVAGRIKEQGRAGEERGTGNNFTRSNWLRFIIYDLGKIIRGGWKSAGKAKGDERDIGYSGGGREVPDHARSRARRERKYMRMKKRERRYRTYPLIQDLFNYGPSPGLSRGRF